jgi:glycosyltransferase involved in cell wall biosynthesis
MRILFVCNEYPPASHGGVGTFTLTLSNHLVIHGHEVHVIGFDGGITQSIERNEQGVHVTKLCSPFKNRAYLQWGRYDIAIQLLERMYLSLISREYCSRHKINVVESYDWSGPLWSHPGPPLLVRMHGAHMAHALYENRPVPRFIKYVEKKNLRMAVRLVGVSQHISEITLKAADLYNRAYDVIYNGVDTSLFHPMDSVERAKNEVLFAGTVSRRKGIYELFSAVPLILKAVPNTRFFIVGKLPGNEKERKTLIDDLLSHLQPDQRQSIQFMDACPYADMPRWYNRASCAIFPSLAEAFGLTCVEAMACGMPVIMTSRASGPEILQDDVSGFLREPTDRDALAEAVIVLLRNPILRKAISLRAVEQVRQKFEIGALVQKNISLYEKLAGRG